MSQLFLDCDGVLADFDTYAGEIFGLPTREAEEKIGTPRFWADLRSHDGFYEKLPLMPDARVLFDAVAHLNPVILTGCPRGGWAEPQKLAWAAAKFPGTKMITTESAKKREHMQPGDILVDDYLKYRHLWEEAGGVFVHHTSAISSLLALKQLGLDVVLPPQAQKIWDSCGKPAASLIPREYMYFACVLPKNHEGECQPGGNCFAHGDYLGLGCPQWPSCVAIIAEQNRKKG